MSTKRPGYSWRLRQLMAERALYKTSELGPLLADRGVVLSAAQVYRLVANEPQRLSLSTLAALCDIFSCTPNDLIKLETSRPKPTVRAMRQNIRPRRARVSP